uniref:Cilia- and flagella-associated protein 52 n=1 Tax=Eptatretus burgeri TaxID=7764 RepID=A0A8C4WUP8_EPTBU
MHQYFIDGKVPSGLIAHPGGEHIVFPLGCIIVIQELGSGKQNFLHGHSNSVSCLCCSRSGYLLASGQLTRMGFKADIILWKFSEQKIHFRLSLHKVKVQSIAFSPNELYLVSLGGQDDGSVVVWDVEHGEAVCGCEASACIAGQALTLCYSNHNDDTFIVGGMSGNLCVWELDRNNRKIHPTNCKLGQLKRSICCLEVEKTDEYFYCGTSSGDVLCVNLKTHHLISCNPSKKKFSQGVTALQLLPDGELCIGAGDGTLVVCHPLKMKRQHLCRTIMMEGSVQSVVMCNKGKRLMVGTAAGYMYQVELPNLEFKLFSSCHGNPVNDIAFPGATRELFGTCSLGSVRVWYLASGREVLRITIPNMTCHALTFAPDGHFIATAWDDGKIRLFLPESGRLSLVVHDAHGMGVTAIAITADCQRIVSGGGEGQVRVWTLLRNQATLAHAMKQHKSTVSSIRLAASKNEGVSASTDGSCIIWDLEILGICEIVFHQFSCSVAFHHPSGSDLERYVCKQMVMSNTLFKCVCYNREEFHIITSGTDRKIGFWEVHDGSLIRELKASDNGVINGMAMNPSGSHFATGGDDRIIRVWAYNEGKVTHIGEGHGGAVAQVCISPDGEHLISVSTDGAIFHWRFPFPGMG